MLIPRRPTVRLSVIRVERGEGASRGRARDDTVTVEEPLEIRVSWGRPLRTVPVSVTMRTPGEDFELAVGFLRTEGLVGGRDDVLDVSYCTRDLPAEQAYNLVTVRLRPGVSFDPERLSRNFYMTSSCGVCGKASLDAVEVQGCERLDPAAGPRLDPALLHAVPARLTDAQRVFRETGGIHAAALLDGGGGVLELREDVGRHNAVDKLVGAAILGGGLPLDEGILAVSGRASFEILQKAAVVRIPVVVAVGAPSSLAVELARRFGLTLVGFTRESSFNVYAGEERVAWS